MKKLLVTLAVDGYSKEITDITFPYMKQYAKKIGATFKVITKRKYPTLPPNIEKFQLYDIAKGYDWVMFIDADAIIHPNTLDLSVLFGKDTVIFHGIDYSSCRFKPDRYMMRDGRYIGACTWFTIFSDWTRELWKPPKKFDVDKICESISLINLEENFGYKKHHIIDDYLVSVNIAKYGLKIKTIIDDVYPATKCSNMFLHEYCISKEDKIKDLRTYIAGITNDMMEGGNLK